MSIFINTIDKLGEEATLDSLLENNITEFNDDTLIEIGKYAFSNADALISVNFPLVTFVANNAFNGCTALEIADFKSLQNIGNYGFYSCRNLKALIIRSENMCNIGGTNNLNTRVLYIYVPRALVESYQSNTIWATWNDRFRAIEDYTVDGTITGDLDWDKVAA